MKATILVRDLVKLIAKHGDLDVKMCIETVNNEHNAKVKCVDEISTKEGAPVNAFEIYGGY